MNCSADYIPPFLEQGGIILKHSFLFILVNDVAIRYEHPQYFSLVPQQRVWQIVDVNVTAVTVMTHMLLPQMLKREKGAIINVCSVSACTPPIPLTAEYSASMVREREREFQGI